MHKSCENFVSLSPHMIKFGELDDHIKNVLYNVFSRDYTYLIV